MKIYVPSFFVSVIWITALTFNLTAQTTEFTYQGRLVDGSLLASGTYEMRFRLFDADSEGTQQPQPGPITLDFTVANGNAVVVTNGVFTVKLNFTSAAFPGPPRFLEIGVRRTAGDSFAPLNPRQPVTSAPHNIRSLSSQTSDVSSNSLQLGGVAANQFVQTGDLRLSDARIPLPNSPNYIQANPATRQSNTSFDIGGNGTVGETLNASKVNTATHFETNGIRTLFMDGNTSSLYGGFNLNLPAGDLNTFFGNLTGNGNTGNRNSFFGNLAGTSNVGGSFNSFFGVGAGEGNISGSENTMAGFRAQPATDDLTNAAAIGANAQVSQNDSMVLGSIAGVNNATTNTKVGIGTTAPTERLHVVGNALFTGSISLNGNVSAFGGTFLGGLQAQGLTIPNNSFTGVTTPQLTVNGPAAVGLFSFAPSTNGSLSICRTSTGNLLAVCSSSIRYKSNINDFGSGLDLINRLRPVSFNWKQGGMPDIGLVAEEVAEAEPLLVTHNDKGEIEGVNYDRIGVVLINAVREQKAQIERQQSQIDALKKIVCGLKPEADVCKE